MKPFLSVHAPTLHPHEALGDGICRILTTHLLSARGLHVVLREAGLLPSGQTHGDTAKITAQHGLFAHKSLHEMGKTRAQAYVSANREALDTLVTLCQKVGVDCSLSRQDAYEDRENQSSQPSL